MKEYCQLRRVTTVDGNLKGLGFRAIHFRGPTKLGRTALRQGQAISGGFEA